MYFVNYYYLDVIENDVNEKVKYIIVLSIVVLFYNC